MPTPRQCAECGASLPSDAPDGFCPRCGLRAALKVDPQPAAPFHPSELFDPLEPGSRRRAEAEESQPAAPPPPTEPGRADLPVGLDAQQRVPTADEVERASPQAGPPPHPSLSPVGGEGARRAGEGDAQPQSAIANPRSAIGRLRYFGDYELLEEIARGGMGVVYRARQVSLNRTVAVKMILAGQLASAADVQRFRAEAEAAANLQHPNIVAIHEVGEHDGQHYFSMDYVEGRNLAEVVREIGMALTGPSDSLSPSEGERAGVRGPSGISNTQWLRRAAGYAKTIAEAIQYAHQRGTLHRDLKPSNVLIDAHDQPRITDFGLAKRVERRSELRVESGGGARDENSQLSTQDPSQLTLSGQVLGSPNFMPPEQAAGKRAQVGPHSDVYSIGAILYHLLTARPPFLAETLSETLQQVQHTDPIAPRLLNPAAPRDLETICQKCLEKEPRQRYATAQALADDLSRFLNGESVHARPVGPAGKAARWCRRKPALAAALAACALVLLTGIAGVTWQWRRAEQNAKNEQRQRQRAEENAARSEQVARFLKDMLAGVKPSVARGRDTKMLREILDKTAERLSKDLTNQPMVEAELRETLGHVYRALGEYAKAEAMAREALALKRKLFGQEHKQVAATLSHLSVALSEQGKYAEAEALARETVEMSRRLRGNNPLDVAGSLNNLATVLMDQGKFEEAEKVQREALAIDQKILGMEHLDVARSLNNLACILVPQGKHAEAEAKFREALAMRKKLLPPNHPSVAEALNNLAALLKKESKYAEAEPLFREALEIDRKVLGNDHPDLAAHLINFASLLDRRGKPAEAERFYREALTVFRDKLGDHPKVANVLFSVGSMLYGQRKYAEAEAYCREALRMRRKLFGDFHVDVAKAQRILATPLVAQGKYAEAESLCREALAIARQSATDDNPQELDDALYDLASRLELQQKYAEAEPLYREVLLRLRSRYSATNDTLLGVTVRLGRSLSDWVWAERDSKSEPRTPNSEIQQRACEAEALLRECMAFRLRSSAAGHWRVGELKTVLGAALVTVVVTDPTLNATDRESKFAEAETLLLDGNNRLQRSKSADQKSKRDALERLVRLYETWDAAAPGSGKSAQAAAWKNQLQLLDAELAAQRAEQQPK